MSDDIDIREGSPEARPPRVPPVSGMRLAVITSGPSTTYFSVKFARWDVDTETTIALPSTVAFDAYVPCLYHRDTLVDDDPDYTQPRLTTGDPVWVAQDYPGGTWLVVGHFLKSSKTCPDA